MTQTLTRVFKAFADATRLRIVRVCSAEELSVGELADVLELPQSSVSRHLAVLREVGAVADRRVGTRAYYRVRDGFDADHPHLMDVITEGIDDAAADLARLDRVLSARATPDAVFDRLAADWDSIRAAQIAPIVSATALTGLVPAELRIADVGCGTGAMLPALARIAATVHAVDRSAPMLRSARARAADAGCDNVEFHRAPMERLPFDAATLDAALLALVLRYAARPQLAVAEAARVVRPGGKVVVVDFVAHDDERFRTELDHVWLGFGRDDLEGWCETAGLQLRSFTTVAPADPAVPPTFVAEAERPKPT